MRKPALIVVLLLLVGGGALVTLGKVEPKTDLSAVMEMWGDVLRDTDQTALQATRIDAVKEQDLGRRLRARLPADDPAWTPYVDAVGQTLVPYVRRREIAYQFHAIDSPEINAFALPGGQIFVFTGLLNFLHSEAELAAILGHEISHVDLRHAVERYQFDPVRIPLVMRYQKYQEIEADDQGIRLSIQAGYDPSVAPVLFSRMQRQFGEPDPQKAATPESEVAQTLTGAVIDYFRSHPLSHDRMLRLDDLIARNHRQLKGRTLYIGVENYTRKIPRTRQQFPAEQRTF